MKNRRRLNIGSASLAGPISGLAILAAAILASPAVQTKKPPAKPAAAPQSSALAAQFNKTAVPFVKKYCTSCHSSPDPDGGLDLEKGLDVASLLKNREAWDRVHQNVRIKHMPPATKKLQPTDAERKAFLTQLEAVFASECDVRDAGRVTMRRLNRYEYANTVRDLLKIDFDPTADFPSDDIGYGFDNNGDVLSISPLLMEKYLNAAEEIVDRAIVLPDYKESNIDPTTMTFTGAGRVSDEVGVFFGSNGQAIFKHRALRSGSYLLKLTAYETPGGPENSLMPVTINGRVVDQIRVSAPKRAPKVHEIPIDLAAGLNEIKFGFANDYFNPNEPNAGRRDRNLGVQVIQVVGPLSGVQLLPASHKAIIPNPPAKGTERTTAQQYLQKFATRAWRRPATSGEVDRLLKVYDAAQGQPSAFEQGMRLAASAILASPHFLFRVELDDKSATGNQPINGYALASRLSYFLWGSMPDDVLMAKASSGELIKPAELSAQVKRMLADPRAASLSDKFAMQWLELERLSIRIPDPVIFPNWSGQLGDDMVTETKLFFTEIVKNNRPVTDFLDGQYTFLNERLAKHYGLPNVTGDQFRKVSLAGTNRGGVMTHGSILTVTSNPSRTSPVKRGKWVLEQILGTPPPPPPPDVGEFSDEIKELKDATTRKRLEMHREDPACATCHARMDPIGFAMENFDAVGAWRTSDDGQPLDTSGVLPGSSKFTGPSELRKVLKGKSEDFVKCLTEKLLIYSLGRGLRPQDRCHIDEIYQQSQKANFTFASLVESIVQSDPFRKKSAKVNP